MSLTDELRSFNRFYTREIGLLNRRVPGGDLSLPEARVLYEIAQAPSLGRTAADVGRTLRMDKGRLSRIVARFRAHGLVESRVSPDHGKRRMLSLTAAGRKAFESLDAGARGQIDGLLAPIDPEGRARLSRAMADMRDVLERSPSKEERWRMRPLAEGDLGLIAHRQARIYHEEYGWDWTYEGLVCQILGAFVAGFHPAREDAWIAERHGSVAGSIFLMKSDDPAVAKLRLLYVEPGARGLGLGHALVATCIARARELGYARLTLWTQDILVAARRIYQGAGFRLVDSSPHRSFGHDLVGETWVLDLARDVRDAQ
jgi:DNA-binding MarR family transcriptional regulator/N-acetylglutamate synthase-like GNAT family acetyltransferase